MNALLATRRDSLGSVSARQARQENRVPATLYGGSIAPISITLDRKELNKAITQSVVHVELDGKEYQAILKGRQYHTYKQEILHVDLWHVTDEESITLSVPLKFTGESIAPGVKIGRGVLSYLMTQIEVRCLFKDLPKLVEVDVSQLRLGESLHISQISLPSGVHIVEAQRDNTVAVIQAPSGSAEDTGDAVAASDVPAAKAKAKDGASKAKKA